MFRKCPSDKKTWRKAWACRWERNQFYRSQGMGFIVCSRSRFHAVSPVPTFAQRGIYQMKKQSSGKNVKKPFFTIEDHLRVQQQIEEHAHVLWHAGGCRHDCALSDWLMAECVIIKQFIQAHVERHSSLQSSRQRAAINGERENPKAQALKRRRTIVAIHPQSTSVLATFS